MKRNKKLLLTSTKHMSREQWLAFRQPMTHVNTLLTQHQINTYAKAQFFFSTDTWKSFVFPCVGGSEVATVLGLDPYKASIEVFFAKVGVTPFEDFDNIAMFWGRELEEQIAQKWQYWDGTIEGMMENFKSGNKLRKCQRVNAYVQNIDFPHLFISLDRSIVKSANNKKTGVLECKTMNSWVAKMWENGLPPQYVVQAQTQMAVCIEDYGEIAYLKDGRDFDVLPFDFNENIVEAVKTRTYEFFLKVKSGIEHFVLSTLAYEQDVKMQHLHAIEMLAPSPDGSEAYKNYLSAKYQDKEYGKPGGEAEFQLAVVYDDMNKQKKVVEAKQTEASNKLKNFMGEANTIDFGARGKVTWKENAKGSRTFRVDIKRDLEVAFDETKKLLGSEEQYAEYTLANNH